MCRVASGVFVEGSALQSRHDDGNEILKEHGLRVAAVPPFVKFSVMPPPRRDFTAPLHQWRYHVDQDILPEWYDRDEYEQLAHHWLETVWYPEHVRDGILHLYSGRAVLYGTSKAVLYGTSEGEFYEDSRGVLRDHSTASFHNSSRATLRDHSRATLRDNATAEMHDSSRASLWGENYAYLYDEAVCRAHSPESVIERANH